MESVDDASDGLLLRLRALASPARLQILRALIVPTRSQEIRVHAAAERAGLGAERVLGRSTVIEHLDILEAAGLVRRIGDSYAVDQQGMVAFLQDLGALARLRAIVEVDVEATREAKEPTVEPAIAPPRALVANGPDAGRAFTLAGPGPWRIGRGAECEIVLAHDPHVSRVHATLRRAADGFTIDVARAAKNPLFVDFRAWPPGATAPAHAGAVVLVGASLLALQL